MRVRESVREPNCIAQHCSHVTAAIPPPPPSWEALPPVSALAPPVAEFPPVSPPAPPISDPPPPVPALPPPAPWDADPPLATPVLSHTLKEQMRPLLQAICAAHGQPSVPAGQ